MKYKVGDCVIHRNNGPIKIIAVNPDRTRKSINEFLVMNLTKNSPQYIYASGEYYFRGHCRIYQSPLYKAITKDNNE